MSAATKTIGRVLVVSVAAVLAIGGCTAGKSSPPNSPAPPVPQPSVALVNWINDVCSASRSLNNDSFLPSGSEPAEAQNFQLANYLRQAPSQAKFSVLALKTLPPSGVRGGDEFVESFIRALRALQAPLSRLAEGADSLTVEVKRQRVGQARELLASVKPEGSDLAALMAGDSVLARAHELAPACHPRTSPPVPAPPTTTPTSEALLPPAADGSDVSACLDGNCEISISAPAEIVVGSARISLTKVTAGQITLRQESSGGYTEATTAAGGMVSLNDIGIRVVGVHGGTALLRIAT